MELFISVRGERKLHKVRRKAKTTTIKNKNTVTMMGLNRTTRTTGYGVCVLVFLLDPFLSPCSDGTTEQAGLPR